MVALIEAAIEPEPSGSVGDGGVIRRGFSSRMDQLKDASANARQYIAGLEQKERDRTGIRTLRVGYNQVFGYYIEVAKSQTGSLPGDYQRRQTLTNAERYIVPELKEYESLVLNAREQLASEGGRGVPPGLRPSGGIGPAHRPRRRRHRPRWTCSVDWPRLPLTTTTSALLWTTEPRCT